MQVKGLKSTAIRQAHLADAELVQQISAEAYLPAYLSTIGAVPKPASEDYRPRVERGEVWLLEKSGTACGVLVIETNPDHLQIYSVAVSPEQQGNGYGRDLLRFAEEQARSIGLKTVRLFTNQRMERNVALYRRCGFVETGKRPHPSRPGETLLDMEKRLFP